jgi:acetylornithine deacetylase/succinyl-diaminopimelate desuccinylase-like protein
MMYNRRPNGVWTSPHLSLWLKLISIQKDHFARGACDDKGQMYMHVKAFEYMIQSNTLLVTWNLWLKGRSGSVNLKPFVENNTENLKMMWF